MEDAQSFLLSSYLGPAPLATTADTATMAPSLLSYPVHGTCSPMLASKGGEGGPKSYDNRKTWFSSLLLLHALQ